MVKWVGDLMKRHEGLVGDRGLCYDYIIGANVVFIEAETPLMSARIAIADCDIRGLAPVKPKLSLTYGSIPQRFFNLALDLFLSDITSEHYVAVIGDAGYRFYVPVQDKNGGRVTYEVGDAVVLEMHSHGQMGAWFSETDNKDETGLKLYGVGRKLKLYPDSEAPGRRLWLFQCITVERSLRWLLDRSCGIRRKGGDRG